MRASWAALGACAVLSACGTTVRLQSQAESSQLLSDGLSPQAQATTGAGTGTTSTGSSSTGTPTATAPVTGTSTTVRPATGPAVDPGKAPAAVATKKPVEVGVVIYPDVKEFAALFGASGSPGDQRAEAQAAIDWVNLHGGLDGHKVVPVFFEVELTSTQPYSQTYQQICESFTTDHHVAAVVFVGNAEAGLPQCLAKKGVVFLAHGHYLRDETDYRSLGNTVTTNDASSLRVARAMTEQMLAKGVVKRGDELGLLVMNYDAPRRGAALMTQLLKEQGVTVDLREIPYPQSTQDISNSAAVVQSAELSFASRQIKSVAFLCPGCATFFMTDAESQGYYPRYVLSSFDTLGGLSGSSHAKSLAGAVAVGWDPMRDVGAYTHPAELAGNPTHQLCRTIEKANGVDDTSVFASQAFCGAFQDLYAAARANPVDALSGATLLAGFDRLGTSHAGTANFSTQLTAARRDGTASYKVMGYGAECQCFQYESRALHALD